MGYCRQEYFKTITANYYKKAHDILVVSDITNLDSFKNLNSWLIEIEKNVNKNVYKFLIDNENDLSDSRQVTYEHDKEFADMYGMRLMKTSAKMSTNKKSEGDQLKKQEKIEINKVTNLEKSASKQGGGYC